MCVRQDSSVNTILRRLNQLPNSEGKSCSHLESVRPPVHHSALSCQNSTTRKSSHHELHDAALMKFAASVSPAFSYAAASFSLTSSYPPSTAPAAPMSMSPSASSMASCTGLLASL